MGLYIPTMTGFRLPCKEVGPRVKQVSLAKAAMEKGQQLNSVFPESSQQLGNKSVKSDSLIQFKVYIQC